MVSNLLSSVNEGLFEPLYHYGPVTALKIQFDKIFVGYGPILKVFQISSEKKNGFSKIFSGQVFSRNKIHSICVSKDGNKVLLTGSRSFAVVETSEILNSSSSSSEKPLVHLERSSGEWLVCGEFLDSNTILTLTAHNVIYKIDVENINSFTIVDKIHCSEKSILYSGSIRITPNGENVYISAGTVMNGVLIWDLKTRKILHHLTEHEGSIFGVKVDETASYIVSCSDDRSIKLYNFATGQLLSTGWGHGSRIWNLEFCKNAHVEDGDVQIFSTGEDCTARLWNYNTIAKNPLLEPLKVVECHLGKHVWSGDIDDVTLNLFVTGGSDGRVIVHSINSDIPLQKYTLENITNSTGCKFSKNEIIKQFVELKQLNILIALTSNGQFFVLNQIDQHWNVLNVPDAEKFINFGLLQAFEETNIVIAAARNGDLLVLNFNQDSFINPSITWIQDQYLQGNKISNLLVSKGDNDSFFVLIDCPNPKIPLILHHFKNDVLVITKLLDQPDQLSFTTTTMFLDKLNGLLIIGSRYVSIAIYDINDETSNVVPIKLFSKKLSIGDTITSLSLVKSEQNVTDFLVTVRDGVYMVIRYENNRLETLHKNKISKGFVEGGYFEGSHLILYGFKSSYFYVWDETDQLELFSELCGGAHRQWSFDHQIKDSCFKFGFINKSDLYIRTYSKKFEDSIINTGTHGREIRDIAISPEEILDSNGMKSRLLFTASEDTMVKVSKLYDNGEMNVIWSMNAHVSGLQKVGFLNSQYAASSAANEEFILWHIRSEMVTDVAHLKPTASVNPDLRIMDFDLREVHSEDGKLIGFQIALVYSDSNIKVFFYEIESNSFKLLQQGRYLTCCLLNINMVTLNSKRLLVIGSTDGHLTIWLEESLDKPMFRVPLHQSGIKATLLHSVEKSSVGIITGGDDNKLVLGKLSFNGDDELNFEVLNDEENAASSTITSINFVNSNEFVVTAVDQIVRRWSIEPFQCISARYTTIADTGSSATSKLGGKDVLVIGGAGLSTWNLK